MSSVLGLAEMPGEVVTRLEWHLEHRVQSRS